MMIRDRTRRNYALTPQCLEALDKFKAKGVNKDITLSFAVEMVSKEPDKFIEYYHKRISESFLNEDGGKNA